ncbi:MAG: hypothetical protein V5A88_09910 [Candidatus Thermoplasmatota archaeon]
MFEDGTDVNPKRCSYHERLRPIRRTTFEDRMDVILKSESVNQFTPSSDLVLRKNRNLFPCNPIYVSYTTDLDIK